MFVVLRATGLPNGALNIIDALYQAAAAVGRVAGSSSLFLFLILSGIIQGCPLAGTCFALSIDPFLSKFKVYIEDSKQGCVRACADDIGAALRSLSCLRPVANIFRDAHAFAGLKLKISKTFLVPLNRECTAHIKEAIRTWLSQNLPY